MVAIRPDVQAGGDRRIGQDEIDRVHREIRDESLQRSLATNEAHGLLEAQRRLQETMGNFLWNDIIDPHYDTQRAPRWAVLECLHEIASKSENFFGITVDETTHLRRNECATGLREQLLSETCLEGTQLRTDRRR
jgi:hypothetical protein